jgi:outer membrane lipoprotein SlyB
MEQLKKLALMGAMLASATAVADTVTGHAIDTAPAKTAVGISGFLLGGAVTGGPVGALIGGGLGWVLGDKSQEAIGVGDTAYRVRKDDGEEVVVRSPKGTWFIGDEVEIIGNRLVAAPSAETARSRYAF